MTRLFFGIDLPPEARARVAELAADLRRSRVDASWVPPENYHVTLRFLGEIPRGAIDGWQARGRDSATRVPAFPVELRGAGAFPSERRPRVLWAGGQGDGASPLARELEAAARQAGLRPDDHPFRVHVTLCRVRSPRIPPDRAAVLAEVLDTWRDRPIASFACGELTLFESCVGGGPARYTPLGRFPLITDR